MPLPTHVTKGAHDAQTLREVGEAHVVALSDDLCVGPIPTAPDGAAFLASRRQYWGPLQALAEDVPHGHDSLLIALEGPIVYWLGASPSDVAGLAWILNLTQRAGLPSSQVGVARPTAPQDFPLSAPLGAYPHASLQTASVSPLTDRERVDVSALWAALTAPTPEPLAALALRHGSLGTSRAARAVLNQLPQSGSPLSHWERLLLEHIDLHGPLAAAVIGHTLIASSPGSQWPPDAWLWSRVIAMSRLDEPPLTITSDRDTPGYRDASLTLTAHGREVLHGAASLGDDQALQAPFAGVPARASRQWCVSPEGAVRPVGPSTAR